MTKKRFQEKDNTPVVTTKSVTTDKKVITTASRRPDNGEWMFLSNEDLKSVEDDPFKPIEDEFKTIELKQIIQLDSTVLEVSDLQKGFSATRKSKGCKWEIQQLM